MIHWYRQAVHFQFHIERPRMNLDRESNDITKKTQEDADKNHTKFWLNAKSNLISYLLLHIKDLHDCE